jgi:hypothetical protein
MGEMNTFLKLGIAQWNQWSTGHASCQEPDEDTANTDEGGKVHPADSNTMLMK